MLPKYPDKLHGIEAAMVTACDSRQVLGLFIHSRFVKQFQQFHESQASSNTERGERSSSVTQEMEFRLHLTSIRLRQRGPQQFHPPVLGFNTARCLPSGIRLKAYSVRVLQPAHSL